MGISANPASPGFIETGAATGAGAANAVPESASTITARISFFMEILTS